MKLRILSFLGIFFVSNLINAQTVTASYADAKYNVVFGVKGGVNFSNQNFNYSTEEGNFDLGTASLTSYHVGFYADWMFNEKFGLQPEILYSREGAKINLFFVDFDQVLSFIKVPVLFKYKPLNKLSLHVGPQFGFLVKEELDIDINDGVELIDTAFKKFELSAAVGTEYAISNSVLVGARYNFGLTNISDMTDASVKTSNLQFYIGLKLF
ncbi:MAG: PorT family protein [Flavobacteriaceae bacterium]|nr:PorT family protein [Flavobacteriaceae bacterium]